MLGKKILKAKWTPRNYPLSSISQSYNKSQGAICSLGEQIEGCDSSLF